jgi:hypothetical protein
MVYPSREPPIGSVVSQREVVHLRRCVVELDVAAGHKALGTGAALVARGLSPGAGIGDGHRWPRPPSLWRQPPSAIEHLHADSRGDTLPWLVLPLTPSSIALERNQVVPANPHPHHPASRMSRLGRGRHTN